MILQNILKTTSKYIWLLEQNWIKTIKDFLLNFPREYENRSDIFFINQIICDSKTTQCTICKIVEKKFIPRGKFKIYEIELEDPIKWFAKATFFNSPYTFNSLEKNKRYFVIGKAKFDYGRIIFDHPSFEYANFEPKYNDDIENIKKSIWQNFQVGRIYPIYVELSRISSSWFAKNTWKLKNQIPEIFREYLPEDFLTKFELMSVPDSISEIHFPTSFENLKKAKNRLFFDKLLRLQIWSIIYKKQITNRSIETKKTNPNYQTIKDFLSKIPFELTNAQKRVINECIMDIHSGNSMIRLVQWDVGSGKTIVAMTIAYYIIYEFGWQVAFLAPLSVLAKQHYININKIFLPMWIYVEFISWSVTKTQKEKIKKKLSDWLINIIVGTHAIIQDNVGFDNLQFVVIDEQHKFWVKQRAHLKKFGNPHTLQMSATPIPRSLAMAFYGEFDVSVIDELPSGRKKIETKIITNKERPKLKPRFVEKINNWQQIFVVVPLVEESESEKMEDVANIIQTYKDIKNLFENEKITNNNWENRFDRCALCDKKIEDCFAIWNNELSAKICEICEKKSQNMDFCDEKMDKKYLVPTDNQNLQISNKVSQYPTKSPSIWLIHGKLKPKEKDEIMADFKSWKTQILVATTVIEVGVDIPQATIMIIMNSERFGLAQLHQLRWRIGRNNLQSYCFLQTEKKSWDSYKRLQNMEKISDWFELAKIDLEYRWAGEILGTRQSWEWDIPIEILSDTSFVSIVQEWAKYLLEKYPNLDEIPALKKFVENKILETLA